MTTKISIMILAVFLLFENSVTAQEKYSLRQCLDFAVNNSYAAHRAKLDEQEADFRQQEARSGILPQVNARGSFDDNVVLGKVILPGEIIGQPGTSIAAEMGSKYALDASASIEQVIFSPSLFTGIKIAKNNLELQRLRSTMTTEEIIFNVSYAFYDILNTVQEWEHISGMLAKQDSLYLLMKQRVDENITREVDLNRLKVNITNLHLRRENIQNTMAQQKRYLQILIGMSVNEFIELDDTEITAVETLYATSLQTPPQGIIELEILNKQKDILDLEIKQVKAGYLPTLSAIVSGGYQFQAENLRLTKEPWYNSVLVGVRLSVPIYDGFNKRSQVRQKQIQRQRLNADFQEAEQTIAMNYQNAVAQLDVTRQSLQAQNENLQLAGKVYEQTVMLYREGLASVTDLLETETSFREAKIAYTAEIIRYKKTEIDLLKANGTLNQSINQLINK
jgi:outer membrane protein TolC